MYVTYGGGCVDVKMGGEREHGSQSVCRLETNVPDQEEFIYDQNR